ncbi:MAG TPA: M20/M25/M40 family metallo-hydrolase [Streptosporangiaceae bacterium]|nr:M20/M25/M40 family metallo-hydrolase [Streptosporangiaceae bacterium]
MVDELVSQVEAWVHERREHLIGELARWVAQPSVSATGEGMPEAQRHAVGLLTSCGLEPDVVRTEGWPVILGRAPGPAQAPHVLIYGHYDVQPPGPLSDWTSPPFSPEIRGNRMFGRGVADNKGQHLAQLLGLRALRELSGGLPGRVTVLLDGEEEICSPHLPRAVREILADDRPDLVIWSDGPVHESGRACVVLGVRGIITFTLRARGPSRPLHSGNWGGVAPNPAWSLVRLLASMRDADGTVLIDGFADEVRPLSPGERAALRTLPLDLPEVLGGIGVTAMEPPVTAGYYERLTQPTFTINSLTCEDAGEHRTVIPSVAVASCDVRLVGGQRASTVIDAIRRHVAAHAPDIEFIPGNSMPPSRTLPESAYTAAVLAGTEAGLGEEPLLVPALGGSLPLAVFSEELDVPCYGIPLANVDESNHAPDENLELDRFLRGIAAAAAVQRATAAHEPGPGPTVGWN